MNDSSGYGHKSISQSFQFFLRELGLSKRQNASFSFAHQASFGNHNKIDRGGLLAEDFERFLFLDCIHCSIW